MTRIGQFISNYGDFGGAESMIARLSTDLASTYDHQVEIYVLGNDTWLHKNNTHPNIKVVTIPYDIQKHWNIRKLPVLGYKLGKFFRERNLDIVHSHMYPGIIRGALSCAFAKIPHIATLHDVYTVKEKPSRIRWLKYAHMLGTKIVVISQEMFHTYTSFGMLKPQDLTVIYNGVDVHKFNKVDTNNIKHNPLFVSAGRLVPIKGYDILLSAVKAVNRPDIQVDILGAGPEMERLQNIAREYEIDKKVHFQGEQSNVSKWLSESDVFVLSSHSEGLSCSIIEAMASSLPIIATNVGGNSELVTHGINGFLTQPGNSVDLAKHMSRFFSMDPNRIKQMGAASRIKAVEKFSLSNMVKEYNTLYHSLVR